MKTIQNKMLMILQIYFNELITNKMLAISLITFNKTD